MFQRLGECCTFRRTAVSSRLAVTTPLTGVTSLRILLAIGVVQRDRSKRSSHWGIDLFEESWSFDMRNTIDDASRLIDRVVSFVGTLSRSSILFPVYRVSGKITFSYVQHSSGSVCA